MEAGKCGFLCCYIHIFCVFERLRLCDVVQLYVDAAGIAAKQRRGNALCIVHRGDTVKLVIAGRAGNRLRRAGHVSVPLVKPPCAVAFICSGRKIVQIVCLVPERQTAGDLFVLQPGDPVDQSAGNTAVRHFRIFIDADLRDLRCIGGIVCCVVFCPVRLFPNILEIAHVRRKSIRGQASCIQLVPGNHIWHAVIVSTILDITGHALSVAELSTVCARVGACKRCMGIDLLDGLIVLFPCFIEISASWSAFIDRNIDNCLINIDFSEIVLRVFWRSVLLLPRVLPRNDSRADVVFQVIAILIDGCGHAEHTVVVAVVHHDLLTAAFQKCLRHVQRVAIRMLRTDGALRAKNFRFERDDGVRSGYILTADAVQETCGAVNDLTSVSLRVKIDT